MRNILFLLLIGILTSCDSKISELNSYTSEFKKVNNYILKNYAEDYSNLISKDDIAQLEIVAKAIDESKLCEVKNYPNKGIVYKFHCEMISTDKFFDSDDKYYLIKILHGNTELLSYEQFVDYSKSPIELKDDWYFIEQNITHD
jgi:hypothetical protein